MPSLPHKPALDPTSTTILVTGASGHIASHIVNEALQLGYRVRGTARTKEKCDNTTKIYDNSNYSAVVVSDFSKPSPEIDEAVKGVDSVMMVASDTTFSEDAETVIGGVIHGVEAFLRAAAREERVKRFTLTSSSSAVLVPRPNMEISVDANTWDDEAVEGAWERKGESIGPNPYPFVVYAASKTEGERALWRFMERERPGFVCNAVLPNTNFGRVLRGGSSGATGGMLVDLFREGRRAFLAPQYYIDVIDDARLHLCAAVLDGGLEDERIFAFAGPFNWNDAVDAIGRVRPDCKVKLEKDPDEGRDLSRVPNELGAKLLKKWFGQDGYKSFDQCVKENLEGV
ncbi:hypothetical protein PMZ80_004929 [Knufia obscura]|uniref:NAD(P)-binding domain-containing protein n=1 Tax=Knufia obscura TaxID=1635080 RepID=A0ABR0RP51_9EURO|nr:hypothetical protein PMZ80_004929 [Knufia obscura]